LARRLNKSASATPAPLRTGGERSLRRLAD